MTSEFSPGPTVRTRVAVALKVRKITEWLLHPKQWLAPRHDIWIVRGEPERMQTESSCARCLQPATISRRETTPSAATSIVVPYCGTCHDALARRAVGQFAWALASTLLGVAGSVFFPLIPSMTQWTAIGSALVFAATPWVLGYLWLVRTGASLPQRSAAYPVAEGLACTSERWARRLAAGLGAEIVQRRERSRITAGWSIAGLVITAVATPVLYDAFHCETRILNLTEEDLVVSVDGHRLATVKATTQENPRAGRIVRIAMGQRRVEARRNDGTPVHAATVHIAAGQAYLYAPAHPADACFWIERTSLGRASEAPVREYLPAHEDFWRIPISIDTWFLPALRSESRFFTGGVVTSLRQGTCPPPRADFPTNTAHF